MLRRAPLWVLVYELDGKRGTFQVTASERAEAFDLLRAHLAEACHVVTSSEQRGVVFVPAAGPSLRAEAIGELLEMGLEELVESTCTEAPGCTCGAFAAIKGALAKLRGSEAQAPGASFQGEGGGGSHRLETAGHHVTAVPDGSAALEAIHRAEWDVLITDSRMAPMGGLQLLEELRTEGRSVYSVLVSGYDDPERLRQIARGAGAQDSIVKPIGEAELRAALERARRRA